MSVTSFSSVPPTVTKSSDTDRAPTSKANEEKPGKPSSPKATASADKAKRQEELNRLLQTYENEIQRGQTASKLKLLAKQITAAASALGQSITLPSTPAAPTAPSTTNSATQGSTSKVNVTA